jgi:hypothetical protein
MTKLNAFAKEAIQRESERTRPDFIRARATCEVNAARRKALDEARHEGVELLMSEVRAKVLDGSEKWPTTVARLLCEQPEKASTSNDSIMVDASTLLELAVPLGGNRMSKPLSSAARRLVHNVMSEFGYDGATVLKGTDIKRVVKAGKRRYSGQRRGITTEFKPTGIVFNGKRLISYRRRDRAPTGLPWQDFTLRIAGFDVPLAVVMHLREIGMQDFADADEEALASATPEERAARQQLNREQAPSRKNRRGVPLLDTESSGEKVKALATIYWQRHSPTREATSGYWELYKFINGLTPNTEEAARVLRLSAPCSPDGIDGKWIEEAQDFEGADAYSEA